MKEVVWKVARTAQGDAAVLFPVIEDFLPQDAPQRLLPTAASLTGAAPASVSPLTALEAALLTALLGVLLAWLASLLLLRRRPPATPADCTAAAGSDPAAPLVLADLPRVPHTGPDWPAASNSSSATAVMACLRFAKLPYTTVPVSEPVLRCCCHLGAIQAGSCF